MKTEYNLIQKNITLSSSGQMFFGKYIMRSLSCTVVYCSFRLGEDTETNKDPLCKRTDRLRTKKIVAFELSFKEKDFFGSIKPCLNQANNESFPLFLFKPGLIWPSTNNSAHLNFCQKLNDSRPT